MAYRAWATLIGHGADPRSDDAASARAPPITEGARRGAHLLNDKRPAALRTYRRTRSGCQRDVVTRAEQTEINEGGGLLDGPVALDITLVPRKRIHEALREIVLVGRDFAGVDITKEPIHIKPVNHYTDGRSEDRRPGARTVEGLRGPPARSPVSPLHGGNRLGANSSSIP